mmetsp:Transcript_72525/g.132842  ORF Transcript_72525/g.132842 Transcript_72525/m.132842 type:complete len:220 (-) Transcript_72525:1921-2580(-)
MKRHSPSHLCCSVVHSVHQVVPVHRVLYVEKYCCHGVDARSEATHDGNHCEDAKQVSIPIAPCKRICLLILFHLAWCCHTSPAQKLSNDLPDIVQLHGARQESSVHQILHRIWTHVIEWLQIGKQSRKLLPALLQHIHKVTLIGCGLQERHTQDWQQYRVEDDECGVHVLLANLKLRLQPGLALEADGLDHTGQNQRENDGEQDRGHLSDRGFHELVLL